MPFESGHPRVPLFFFAAGLDLLMTPPTDHDAPQAPGASEAPSPQPAGAGAVRVVRPDELVESERFQKHLARNVPIRRVAREEEQAELALFLASDKSDFIVGQVVPFSGGWVTTT